jgi:hypothetical protein
MIKLDIAREIQILRTKITASFLRELNPKTRTNFLEHVWALLFSLAEYEDPSIHFAVCGTIGGMIFSLIPFYAGLLGDSFAAAISETYVNSKISIVITATFRIWLGPSRRLK